MEVLLLIVCMEHAHYHASFMFKSCSMEQLYQWTLAVFQSLLNKFHNNQQLLIYQGDLIYTDSCTQIFCIYYYSITVIMLCYTSQAKKELCT